MASDIDFDWDRENRAHLAAHKVVPAEFEELILNEPVDVSFETTHGEERYRSVGLTNAGRLLSAVWTIRGGRIRAITAFPAGRADKRAFLEKDR